MTCHRWAEPSTRTPTPWDELNLGGVVADLLEVSGKLVLNLLVSLLGVVDGFVVHLVHAHDHLLDTHSLGEEGVLSSLSVLGETASNSPSPPAIMRMAASAGEVPVIMFLMKSRWPGASMMVKILLADSNFQRAMSIVIPRSRSAFVISSRT